MNLVDKFSVGILVTFGILIGIATVLDYENNKPTFERINELLTEEEDFCVDNTEEIQELINSTGLTLRAKNYRKLWHGYLQYKAAINPA